MYLDLYCVFVFVSIFVLVFVLVLHPSYPLSLSILYHVSCILYPPRDDSASQPVN